MNNKKFKKAILAGAIAYSLWGLTLLASTLGQRKASPFVLLMYRFDISTILMLFPLLIGKQKFSVKGKKFGYLILLGLTEPIVYFIGEQYGLKYTNSSFTGIMIALIPIFSIFFASIILKDRATKLQWLFSLISIAGVIAITIITTASDGVIQPIGVALLSTAVLCGGLYGVLSRITARDFTVYERTLFIQFMGALFFSGMAVIENRSDLSAIRLPATDITFMLSALYLAIGASVIGYTLINYAVSNAPMAYVSSLCNLTTVLSVIVGVIILHEPFSIGTAIGMAVVLFGIWGVQKYGKKEE